MHVCVCVHVNAPGVHGLWLRSVHIGAAKACSSSQCISNVQGQWWPQQQAKAASSSGSSSGRPSSEDQSKGHVWGSIGSSKAGGRGLMAVGCTLNSAASED